MTLSLKIDYHFSELVIQYLVVKVSMIYSKILANAFFVPFFATKLNISESSGFVFFTKRKPRETPLSNA